MLLLSQSDLARHTEGPSSHSEAAGPGNDLGEINKYVNVYFLLNLKAASIKIFDF